MERELPEYIIGGTTFLVDVEKDELREVGNPDNTISFKELRYMEDHYRFAYDITYKNICDWWRADHPDAIIVELPLLVKLDPEGMARRYGKTLAEMEGKNDLDVMINHDALEKRMAGKQTTIDIAGQLFYVNSRFGVLQPKDDFSSTGITFKEVEQGPHLSDNRYRFVYDPATHQIGHIDYGKITAIPKGLIMVEIMEPKKLDPYGYARDHRLELNEILRQNPLKEHHVAKIIPWNKTGLLQVIRSNLKQKASVQQGHKKHGRNKGTRL